MNKSDFEKTIKRLEEILEATRNKDTDLDKAVELLEEGAELLSECVQGIDYDAWLSESGLSPTGDDVSAD